MRTSYNEGCASYPIIQIIQDEQEAWTNSKATFSRVLHSQIYGCVKWHRESKNTKLYEIGSGTKLLFTFLSLKGFSTWGEREKQSFYADCFYIVCSQPNQRAAPVAHKVVWPRLALKVNLLLPRRELKWLLFLKSQPALPVRDVTHHLVSIPIWYFYFDISEWHILSARAWTPALMLHLTNPCAKRKVLSLTKPKGKIYKTKSLRKYIIRGLLLMSTLVLTDKQKLTYISFVWFGLGVF